MISSWRQKSTNCEAVLQSLLRGSAAKLKSPLLVVILGRDCVEKATDLSRDCIETEIREQASEFRFQTSHEKDRLLSPAGLTGIIADAFNGVLRLRPATETATDSTEDCAANDARSRTGKRDRKHQACSSSHHGYRQKRAICLRTYGKRFSYL